MTDSARIAHNARVLKEIGYRLYRRTPNDTSLRYIHESQPRSVHLHGRTGALRLVLGADKYEHEMLRRLLIND